MKPPSDYSTFTIAYYDTNSIEFRENTATVDMSELYVPFLSEIPVGGRILDAGCGSGRDSLAFMQKGYHVVSIDASREMVAATSKLTGHTALLMAFDEIPFQNEFDGIWACASLLHVARRDLQPVLSRLCKTLKPNGVFYLSFKHGDYERVENGRFFNDLNETLLRALLASQSELELLGVWITEDVRNERGGRQQWLNAIVRRRGAVLAQMAMQSCADLLQPSRLWTRAEVLSRPSPVPKAPGVYAWYFRPIANVPASGCHVNGDFRLLYVGISPSAPPMNGKRASRQSLYHRVRYHMNGNAEGSTLRLSLGCLLADELGIELRRVGSGNRLTFSIGEERLSRWMDENARVVWKVCEEPWKLEGKLIATLNLPLNLDLNIANAFFPVLSELRRTGKVKARALPILPR